MVWELMALLSAGFAVCIHRPAYCTGLCRLTCPVLVIALHYSLGVIGPMEDACNDKPFSFASLPLTPPPWSCCNGAGALSNQLSFNAFIPTQGGGQDPVPCVSVQQST